MHILKLLPSFFTKLFLTYKNGGMFSAVDTLELIPKSIRKQKPDSYWVRHIGRLLSNTDMCANRYIRKHPKEKNRVMYSLEIRKPVQQLTRSVVRREFAVDTDLRAKIGAVLLLRYDKNDVFTIKELCTDPALVGTNRRVGIIFRDKVNRDLLGIEVFGRKDGYKKFIKLREPLDDVSRKGRLLLEI